MDIVKQIASGVDIPVQCGGGIRTLDTIGEYLDSGLWRVVLGTKAAEDKDFLRKAFKKFKDKIIVSVDVSGNKVLIKGWRKSSSAALDADKFTAELKEIGFKELIYTDISKDGMLKGPNIQGIKALLKKSGLKLIASGGISSLDDIYKLKMLEKSGLTGAIVGKALYEGKFTLTQAIKLV
jgi:phosphoribosylformimino-5-aminoimidazole carboxamide ribotide isomerase